MKQYIKREFLTLGEIQSIVKVKLPVARLDRVRDIFLFSCFTGLTFDDVDKLKEYNIEVLENGKRLMKIYIPLSNKIREIPLLTIPCMILDKYKGKLTDGKLLPRKAAMNYNLKEIARLCGINRNLTFHLARHTFIGTVTVANGISLKTVADILGHTQLTCIRSFIVPTNDKVQGDMATLSGKLRKIEKLFNA
ncbi:site-specific integrase [Phocaeicola sp.]